MPCWVREMSDGDAYMALVLANAQGELHPLEEGKHAAESGLDLKTYAEVVGKARTSLSHKALAYRVYAVTHMGHDLRDRWRCLAELHAAPSWLWPALAAELVERGWTVETTASSAPSRGGSAIGGQRAKIGVMASAPARSSGGKAGQHSRRARMPASSPALLKGPAGGTF